MRFAHPVLQERARVAEQARDARVRLTEGTPSVALQQFMTERLRLIDSDLDAVSWDAYRSDDGTWQVTGAWRAGDKSGTTRWSFDLPSRTVTPSDAATMDFAEGTRLVRVVPDVPGRPDRRAARRGRRPSSRDAGRRRRRPGRTTTVHDTRHPRRPAGATSRPHDDEPRPRRARRRPAPRTTTGRSTRCSTRSPSTTPSCSAAAREDAEDDDPRARIPAWEDIVFGVRRHR